MKTEADSKFVQVVKELNSEGINHDLILSGEDYIIVRTNNVLRTKVKLKVSSQLLSLAYSRTGIRSDIQRRIILSMANAERRLVARR